MHTGKGQPVHPKLNPKMNRIEYLNNRALNANNAAEKKASFKALYDTECAAQ